MRISLALFLLLTACAQPNYVTTDGRFDGGQHEKPTVCQAKFSTQVCVSLVWQKNPTETEFGSFVLKIFRPNVFDGTPIVIDPPGDVSVILWMPGMGHGSSPVRIEKLDTGTYHATNVFFTMRGEWDIRVQLKAQDELKDQAIISLTF